MTAMSFRLACLIYCLPCCRRSVYQPNPAPRLGEDRLRRVLGWPLWSVRGVQAICRGASPGLDCRCRRPDIPASPACHGARALDSFEVLNGCMDFRGVSYDRLPTILAAGIDVEPTTAPIFVSDFDKAWEYGDWPKVIMAFDGMHLDYTYRQITSDIPADEAARLMQEYPTRLPDHSGAPDEDRPAETPST